MTGDYKREIERLRQYAEVEARDHEAHHAELDSYRKTCLDLGEEVERLRSQLAHVRSERDRLAAAVQERG